MPNLSLYIFLKNQEHIKGHCLNPINPADATVLADSSSLKTTKAELGERWTRHVMSPYLIEDLVSQDVSMIIT